MAVKIGARRVRRWLIATGMRAIARVNPPQAQSERNAFGRKLENDMTQNKMTTVNALLLEISEFSRLCNRRLVVGVVAGGDELHLALDVSAILNEILVRFTAALDLDGLEPNDRSEILKMAAETATQRAELIERIADLEVAKAVAEGARATHH